MGERVDTSFNTTGCRWLQPFSEYLGLPLDQVNFLACQFFALLAAFWFRLYLSPSYASPLVRHAMATLLGLAFLIFSFGWYSAHIVIVVTASYAVIVQADINKVHKYSMWLAMGYLLLCQVSRAYIFHYGILSTDFSAALMIVTQKVTTLAFQLHDGMCKNSEELTKEQKLLAINKKPSLVEYMSYNLNFLSVLVGPCSNYKDYKDFIEGRHISSRLQQQQQQQQQNKSNGHNGCHATLEPSPVKAVCRKLLVCSGCMLFFLLVTRSLPIKYNVDQHFVGHAPFLTRLTYAFFSIQAARPKFYFAWTLADAVNNAAGYGFAGMDESGEPSWDLIRNVNILGIETATSFKTFIDNWNICTGAWLKTVCYDRAPKHRLALTFVLSALWHGVYPGYYFTFLTAIPITIAARAIRRSVRHHFLAFRGLKLGYDIMTWTATQFAICYTVMPFLLLAVDDTLVYYRSMYYHVHIISILAAVALRRRRKPGPKSGTSQDSAPSASSSNKCPPTLTNNNDKIH